MDLEKQDGRSFVEYFWSDYGSVKYCSGESLELTVEHVVYEAEDGQDSEEFYLGLVHISSPDKQLVHLTHHQSMLLLDFHHFSSEDEAIRWCIGRDLAKTAQKMLEVCTCPGMSIDSLHKGDDLLLSTSSD